MSGKVEFLGGVERRMRCFTSVCSAMNRRTSRSLIMNDVVSAADGCA